MSVVYHPSIPSCSDPIIHPAQPSRNPCSHHSPGNTCIQQPNIQCLSPSFLLSIYPSHPLVLCRVRREAPPPSKSGWGARGLVSVTVTAHSRSYWMTLRRRVAIRHFHHWRDHAVLPLQLAAIHCTHAKVSCRRRPSSTHLGCKKTDKKKKKKLPSTSL